jgi:hypothetical protein
MSLIGWNVGSGMVVLVEMKGKHLSFEVDKQIDYSDLVSSRIGKEGRSYECVGAC